MVIVPKSYAKHYWGNLCEITRCPREGCDGDLRFSVGGDENTDWKQGCGGYEDAPTAKFRCQKCNLGIVISNPRSFLTKNCFDKDGKLRKRDDSRTGDDKGA